MNTTSNTIPPDISRAKLIVMPTTVLFVFSLTVFVARMQVRYHREKIGLDDWFLMAAMVRSAAQNSNSIV